MKYYGKKFKEKYSRKNIRRMIAIFLILTLSFMPRATAQTVIGDSSSETVSVKDVSSSFDQPDLEHNPVILREDISKRGEYEKHFLNDDGGFTAVSYHEPVHYQKADGRWGEIDNTLLEVTNEDGPKRYKNKDGLFDVSFAEYPGKDMVSIATKDGCQITFGPVLNKQEITVISDLSSSASSDSSEQTTESEKIAEHSASGKSSDRFLPINENTTARMRAKDLSAIPPEEHKMVADKVYSEIVFEDALGSGTDIEYIVSANQVKENLILESAADIAPYSFQLIADGLTAVLNPDNTIEFSDPSGNIVFYMPAPFMFNSGDGYSEAIVVELTKADGFYILTYLPDCAWLESPDRVWPVTVDPTVKTKTSVSYIDDRTVKNTGGTCSLTEPYLYVGLRNGQTHYSYIQHHCGSNNGMPTIPARSLITASFARAYINSSTANNVPLTASMVNTSWNGSTLTYANRPTNLTTLVSGVKPTSGYYEFNVTEALGRWYSGNTNTTGNNKNYGIRLSTTSGSESVKLYSGNFSAASMRPVIHVNYLPEVTNIPVGKYFIRNKLILNGSERYLDVHNGVVANHQPLVSWIYKGLTLSKVETIQV